MNNLDNNILIAKFMGGQYVSNGFYENFIQIDNGIYDPRNLQYDTDWNWLMNVVDRIENMYDNEEEDSKIRHYNIVTTSGNHIMINYMLINDDGSYIEYQASCFEDTKLNSLYNSIIKFINYYNEEILLN